MDLRGCQAEGLPPAVLLKALCHLAGGGDLSFLFQPLNYFMQSVK